MQCPALPSSASQVDHPCSLHILSLSASVLLFVQIHHLPLNRLLCPPAEGAGSFHKGSRVAAPLLHRGESFHTCWPARAQTGAEGALYLVLSFQVARECHVLCSPSQWHPPMQLFPPQQHLLHLISYLVCSFPLPPSHPIPHPEKTSYFPLPTCPRVFYSPLVPVTPKIIFINFFFFHFRQELR